MKDCKKCNGDGYFYEADRRTPTRCECQNINQIKTMKYEKGTTLTGRGLNLILQDSECVTEALSCGEDEWIYHWLTPEGRSHITTDTELAGLLADGAIMGHPFHV